MYKLRIREAHPRPISALYYGLLHTVTCRDHKLQGAKPTLSHLMLSCHPIPILGDRCHFCYMEMETEDWRMKQVAQGHVARK